MKIYGEIHSFNKDTGMGSILDEQNNMYWFLIKNVIVDRTNPKVPAGKVLFNINIRDDFEEVREAYNIELL